MDTELAQVQQQLRQLRQQVIFIPWSTMRQEQYVNIGLLTVFCVQEQSSRLEIDDLERQLQSSEALVADLKENLQQRDTEPEILRSKVGLPNS